ncbi:mannonate dehydratase [Shigella flexneri]
MYYQKVELIRHLIRCNATAVWLFIRIPKQLQGSASLRRGTHYVKEEKSWNRPWRWYGPNDPVSLATSVRRAQLARRTALHHIPTAKHGPLKRSSNARRSSKTQARGWVCCRKRANSRRYQNHTGNYEQWIANYQQTLRNLAQCGIRTVCYNFMPVLYWTLY